MIELRRRLVIFPRPILAPIQRHSHTTVVRRNHAPRIARIDPQSMVVAVGNFDFIKQMAAVSRLETLHIHDIDHVLISGIGKDVHVIPRPLPQAVARIDEIPSLAAIIRPVEPAIRIASLDQSVDAIRVGCDGDSDAPIRPLRESVFFESLPGRAAVTGAIESAPRPAVRHVP